MSNDTKTGQKPTYEVFAVTDGAEGKASWKKIGAAWPHKDGKGFSLKGFSLQPFSDAAEAKTTIHLRAVKAGKGGAQ